MGLDRRKQERRDFRDKRAFEMPEAGCVQLEFIDRQTGGSRGAYSLSPLVPISVVESFSQDYGFDVEIRGYSCA